MERKIKLILKDILLYKNHTNILMVGDNNILENIVNDLIKDTLVLDSRIIVIEDIKNSINSLEYYNNGVIYILLKYIDKIKINIKNIIENVSINVKFIFFTDNFNMVDNYYKSNLTLIYKENKSEKIYNDFLKILINKFNSDNIVKEIKDFVFYYKSALLHDNIFLKLIIDYYSNKLDINKNMEVVKLLSKSEHNLLKSYNYLIHYEYMFLKLYDIVNKKNI